HEPIAAPGESIMPTNGSSDAGDDAQPGEFVGPLSTTTMVAGIGELAESNEAPAVWVVGNLTMPEGPVTITQIATFTDDDSTGPFTYRIDWGDGTDPTTGTATIDVPGPPTFGSFNGEHVYGDNGVYLVAVTVTDEQGATSEVETFEMTVTSVAPEFVGDVVVTSPIDEGEIATLSGTLSSPSVDDVLTLVVNWGDGTSDTFEYPGGTTPFEVTHLYENNQPGNAPYLISLVLTDDDGGGPATALTSVVVHNAAPTAVDDYYVFDGVGMFVVSAAEGVLVNDHDPGNDGPLSAIDFTDPLCDESGLPCGILTMNEDGAFTYTPPNAVFTGTVTFTYKAIDAEGAVVTAAATVAIDVGMNSSITGYVFAANLDPRFQPDELPLPGVIVELAATDGRAVVTMNTMTAEDGSYRFEGLRAGTYQITQRQPAACIDGATHVISDVVVGANETTVDQNFAENWLQPQNVSIGSFLASTILSSPTTYGWSVGLREKMARAEEAAGNVELAEEIRVGQRVEFAQRGLTLTITGTRADEDFAFTPGVLENTITIGGKPYRFDAADVRRFKIVGGGGSDAAELFDSPDDDRLEGRYNWAKLSSDEFNCELLDFDWIRATSSNGGDDTTDIEETIDYLLETVGDWSVV
ncbi:MAG TPA: hypothetical protein DD670_05110, partial [Planctomycetaceae bacterium]|nr:hypothetical protein [Planctomycetaceae bacterium]